MNEGLRPSGIAVGAALVFSMKQKRISLGRRLGAIAAEVREGVVLYDVGTDHAYLPVFLLGIGRISCAVASDVVPGPLARAAETVKRAGMTEQITLHLADGLQGIALTRPCDITMAGMGGELIASILEAAPQVRAEGVRLILQPMTKPENLRRYLAAHGFAVEREKVVEEGKLYEIMVCHYDGIPYPLSEEEALLGRYCMRCEDDAFVALLSRKREVLRRKADGQRQGGETDPALLALLETLDTLAARLLSSEAKGKIL
ncbi:MAG: SAM-dependent methyltransferase [Ruminococcaceae bacterium]|nr:SAM-dependent methyltransferase [Oscillospiraceae bacterium]